MDTSKEKKKEQKKIIKMVEYLDPVEKAIEDEEIAEPTDEEPEEEEQQVIYPQTKEDEKESSEIGIIKELSPKRILEQLRMNLKGFFWDYEKKAYIKIEGFEPLMNDQGIAKYLSIMSSVITDLVTFSNYKDEEINRYTLYVCDKALPTIHINYKEYGIKNKSDLQIIDIQIFNLTHAAFKKAVGAGDRNIIRGTVSESIAARMYPTVPHLQQESFLSKMNPFKR